MTAVDRSDGGGMNARPYRHRELEVARLLAAGLLNKEIAYKLGIGEATVKAHAAAFAKKAGLTRSSRVAVALAYLRLCDDVERDAIIGCAAPIRSEAVAA